MEGESQQRVRTRSQSLSRASVERKTGKQSTGRSASKKKATRNQKQGVSSRGSGKGHNWGTGHQRNWQKPSLTFCF